MENGQMVSFGAVLSGKGSLTTRQRLEEHAPEEDLPLLSKN